MSTLKDITLDIKVKYRDYYQKLLTSYSGEELEVDFSEALITYQNQMRKKRFNNFMSRIIARKKHSIALCKIFNSYEQSFIDEYLDKATLNEDELNNLYSFVKKSEEVKKEQQNLIYDLDITISDEFLFDIYSYQPVYLQDFSINYIDYTYILRKISFLLEASKKSKFIRAKMLAFLDLVKDKVLRFSFHSPKGNHYPSVNTVIYSLLKNNVFALGENFEEARNRKNIKRAWIYAC